MGKDDSFYLFEFFLLVLDSDTVFKELDSALTTKQVQIKFTTGQRLNIAKDSDIINYCAPVELFGPQSAWTSISQVPPLGKTKTTL